MLSERRASMPRAQVLEMPMRAAVGAVGPRGRAGLRQHTRRPTSYRSVARLQTVEGLAPDGQVVLSEC